MERINLVELLKDCIGMELDCAVFDNVTLYRIDTSPENEYPIRIETKSGNFLDLTKYGTYLNLEESKCVIFPKGKTTWEGFVPSSQFKDGDILSYQCTGYRNRTIYIYRHHPTMNTSFYVALDGDDLELMVSHKEGYALSGNNTTARLATEDEKAKLFQAIKDRGYRWNEETKTLEKLNEPKFKIGNWYQCIKDFFGKGVTFDKNTVYYCAKEGCLQDEYGCHIAIFKDLYDSFKLWTIQDAKDGDVLVDKYNNIGIFQTCVDISWYSYIYLGCGCNGNALVYTGGGHIQTGTHPATEEEKEKLFNAIKENGYKWDSENKTLEKLPKFKVGDKIKEKQGDSSGEIIDVQRNKYNVKVGDKGFYVYFREQDDYELVPDKFDITTLVPFESRVLARNNDREKWHPGIWGYYDSDYQDYPYRLIGDISRYCIPYEGNEHLRGKTKDCDEYFKTWEKTGD